MNRGLPSVFCSPWLALAVACCTLGNARVSSAQTAQPVSFHVSALSTRLSVGAGAAASNGFGVEVQLRRTYGAFSLGVGAQFTQHDGLSAQLGGAMIEPRLVLDVGSTRAAPYLAARVGYVRVLNVADATTQGLDLGAGAGLIVPLGVRVNLDLGGALVQTNYRRTVDGSATAINSSFSTINYAAKLGLSIGL